MSTIPHQEAVSFINIFHLLKTNRKCAIKISQSICFLFKREREKKKITTVLSKGKTCVSTDSISKKKDICPITLVKYFWGMWKPDLCWKEEKCNSAMCKCNVDIIYSKLYIQHPHIVYKISEKFQKELYMKKKVFCQYAKIWIKEKHIFFILLNGKRAYWNEQP